MPQIPTSDPHTRANDFVKEGLFPPGLIQNYSTALIRSIPHGFGADETSARPAVETAKRWLGGVLGG